MPTNKVKCSKWSTPEVEWLDRKPEEHTTVPKDAIIDPLSKAVFCPKCRGDYSHIVNVFTRLGVYVPERPESAYQGTQVLKVVPHERQLVIVFEGECGHVFEWQIEQHEGYNFVKAEFVRSLPTEESEPYPLKQLQQ